LAVADLSVGLVAAAAFGFMSGDHRLSTLDAALSPIWILSAKLLGLYDRDHRALRHLTVDELPTIAAWTASTTAVLVLINNVATVHGSSEPAAGVAWLFALAAALLFRSCGRVFWRRVTPRELAVVIGSGPASSAVRRKLELFNDIHIEVVGLRDKLHPEDIEAGLPWLYEVDRLIVATEVVSAKVASKLIPICRSRGVKLNVVPPAPGVLRPAVKLRHVADLPVLDYNTWDVPRSTQLLKRIFDASASAVMLVATLPLLLVIAALIKVDSRGPIFFVQQRAGLRGEPFDMFKFRTMLENAEGLLDDLVPFDRLQHPVFKLVDDPRITRLGRLLRRTSVDELPQLVNVLFGQMSLVGPRPEQIELVSRYEPEHLFRLEVKPGMTGPMQVFGRGDLTFPERLAVEREYVENLSLGRDIQLLMLTIPAVLGMKGAT
jgi:exopolysaccharide biosynthesis polyprenyl glycosylphosphotransferase